MPQGADRYPRIVKWHQLIIYKSAICYSIEMPPDAAAGSNSLIIAPPFATRTRPTAMCTSTRGVVHVHLPAPHVHPTKGKAASVHVALYGGAVAVDGRQLAVEGCLMCVTSVKIPPGAKIPQALMKVTVRE